MMKNEFGKNDISHYAKMLKITEEQLRMLTDQQFDIIFFIHFHGSITPMDAFSDLGITKLATRISEMKSIGIQFDQEFEGRENRFGKKVRYMRYRRAAA